MINQPGGAGAVAIKARVGRAAPDGHTLYMALATQLHRAAGDCRRTSRSTWLRDFVPIGFVGEQPMVIAASRRRSA